MSDDVERAARAIGEREDTCDWDERPENRSSTIADFTPKETLREYARAALSATKLERYRAALLEIAQRYDVEPDAARIARKALED